jgi:outer membrane protein
MQGMNRVGLAAVLAAAVTAGTWLTAPGPAAQQAPPAATPAAVRIGYVDVQRVLARSAAGVAAREQLEREKAAMQKQVDTQRVELEKMREDLEKKGQLLSPEARRERQDTMEKKVRETRRLVDDLQATLQKKEEQLLGKVLSDVSGLIQKVGKDKGYYMVLERQRSSVLYAAAEADLTEEIIRAYDEDAKKAKK